MTEPSNRLIKDSILLLCNVVNRLLGEHTLLASQFRHAKFNKSDDNCVLAFWKTLHRLSCSKPTCDGSLAECVKINFARLNYKGHAFYALSNDILSSNGAEGGGSRELLLAFSWLIANRQMEKLIDELIGRSGLNELYPSTVASFEPKIISLVNLNSAEDQQQYILWFLGRLRLKMNAIEGLKTQRNGLRNKIRAEVADNVSGDVDFTPLETYLLCERGNELNNYQGRLNEICEVVESYFLWLKKSKIYFKWMASVVEERRNDRSNSTGWVDLPALNNFKKSLVRVIKDTTSSTRDDEPSFFDASVSSEKKAEIKARLLSAKGKLDNNLNKYKKSLRDMNIMLLVK